MSHPMTLFSQLCTALRTCANLPKCHPKHQRELLTFAQSLARDFVENDKIKDALNAAMYSGHVALIETFPVAASNRYATSHDKRNIELWAQTIEPEVVIALSQRGLDLKEAYSSLMTRAFRQKNPLMRSWAMEFIATQPRDFSWLHTFTPHNLSRNPDFGAQMLQKACDVHPIGGEDMLSRSYNRIDSLRACLLLHGLPKTMAWDYEPKVASITNHQKMGFWRGNLAAFCQDKDAIRAARHIFG